MAIDIDQSFYNTGTASIDNGGTIVTGQGTQWVSSIRANDIFGTHKGDGVRILSVESNTSLTLAYPWTGETQATAPYEVQFTPYDTGYYPAVRQLLQTMASGNVEAFAGLNGTPNMVPIFTGPGAMELADPSTFGLQDPNGSLGKLAALTLAANKALTTDGSGNAQQNDLGTLGRALLALAFGTSGQIVQADGNVIDKSTLPVSTATQTALDTKFNNSGGNVSGDITIRKNEPRLSLVSAGAIYGTTIEASVSDVSNFGLRFLDSGTEKLRVGGNGAPSIQVFGNASVSGTISKGGGTLKTDHPLDPMNKNIRYGFTEGARYYLVHIGTAQLVNGRAVVDIDATFDLTPGTFAAMNQNAFVTSLNHQGSFERVINTEIEGGSFEIICENDQASSNVVWTVIGERADAFVRVIDPNCERGTGRFIPEFDKPEFEEPTNG